MSSTLGKFGIVVFSMLLMWSSFVTYTWINWEENYAYDVKHGMMGFSGEELVSSGIYGGMTLSIIWSLLLIGSMWFYKRSKQKLTA